MAFEKKLVADSVVARLIEGQGMYSLMNRSFDGLVQPGASSVDIPKLAIPVVKTAGYSLTGSDRKKGKADTTMMNVALATYSVPLAEEILARYESNGKMIKGYIDSAVMTLQEYFDTLTLAAAQAGLGSSDRSAFAGASMAWADVIDISKRMDVNKVPKSGRVIAIDANLAAEFFGIDVVKNAISYNQNYLSTGTFIQFMGMSFFITGLLSTITVSAAQKYTMVGIYGPGVAAIVSKFGDLKEAWDSVNLQTVYDVITHFGAGLLDEKFAVVKYKP